MPISPEEIVQRLISLPPFYSKTITPHGVKVDVTCCRFCDGMNWDGAGRGDPFGFIRDGVRHKDDCLILFVRENA